MCRAYEHLLNATASTELKSSVIFDLLPHRIWHSVWPTNSGAIASYFFSLKTCRRNVPACVLPPLCIVTCNSTLYLLYSLPETQCLLCCSHEIACNITYTMLLQTCGLVVYLDVVLILLSVPSPNLNPP